MPNTLLTTKLYIPPARPGIVARPHLLARLDEGLERKLILVSAPAGFGKTTLLNQWVSRGDMPVAWVSLDEGDNDVARFLTYIVSALQTIQPAVGQAALALLQSPRPSPGETLLTNLINDVAEIPHHFVLVLDDYHLVTEPAVQHAVTFLLDHLPPCMHLVIATRADPPLPLARLRGRGQLVELRAVDLRFTLDEATAFLNQVMDLDLSARDVAVLDAHTEGWVAGLQMAAVSLQGRTDLSAFIRAFTGSNRYVLDYLLEEVLQRQPGPVQEFLLQTAILDRLSGPLCDAVTGQPGGQQTLEAIERANLFVVPLDSERRWYRYHRLFADLLRQRLQQVMPGRVVDLHRRACAWLEQNGLLAAAVDHALDAHDFGQAANLIERVSETTLMRSEVATFLRWMAALPDAEIRTRPLLCVFHAGALLVGSHPVEMVEARLDDALKSGPAAAYSGEVAVIQALIAAFQGDTARSAELARTALELLPEHSLFFRSLVTSSLGITYMISGNVTTAFRILEEAIRIGQKTNNPMVTVMAHCQLAELCAMRGQPHEAQAYYERALELAVDGRGRRLPIAGMALIGLGELLREWNDLEAAARHLEEGIELIRRWAEIGTLDGYITLAGVRQAQGDPQAARQAIQTAQDVAIRFEATEIDDALVAIHQARLCIAQGDFSAVARWASERELDAAALAEELAEDESKMLAFYYLRKLEYATLARLHIAQNEPGQALVILNQLLPVAERFELRYNEVDILLLKALSHHLSGDLSDALAALGRALALAEPAGYIRIFLDKGPPLAQLLYRAVEYGMLPEYAGRLLAAFSAQSAAHAAEPPAWDLGSSLVEPLSEREQEVLALIADGLSNQEIAQRLVVSLSTVKWHTSNIYSKLAVRNRTQAVAKARSMGIIRAD